MPSKKPYIQIRTTPEIKAKLNYIAEQDGRSDSNYCEMLIKKAISKYELEHGPINTHNADEQAATADQRRKPDLPEPGIKVARL